MSISPGSKDGFLGNCPQKGLHVRFFAAIYIRSEGINIFDLPSTRFNVAASLTPCLYCNPSCHIMSLLIVIQVHFASCELVYLVSFSVKFVIAMGENTPS